MIIFENSIVDILSTLLVKLIHNLGSWVSHCVPILLATKSNPAKADNL